MVLDYRSPNGGVYNQYSIGCYRAKRWDGTTKTFKPIGDQNAHDAAIAFVETLPHFPCTAPSAVSPATAKADALKIAAGSCSGGCGRVWCPCFTVGVADAPAGPIQKMDDGPRAGGSIQKTDGPSSCAASSSECMTAPPLPPPAEDPPLSPPAEDPPPEIGDCVLVHVSAPPTPPLAASDMYAFSRHVGTTKRYTGLFAALLASAVYRTQVNLVMASEVHKDILAVHCPHLLHKIGGYSSDGQIFIAPCRTSQGSVQLPSNDAELLACNHYTPLAHVHNDLLHRAVHDPCDGSCCGGFGYPCISLMTARLAPLGFIPFPVPGDGDCLMHSLLWGMGRSHLGPAGSQSRNNMRHELATFAKLHANDPELQQACLFFGEKGLALEDDIARMRLEEELAVEDGCDIDVDLPDLMDDDDCEQAPALAGAQPSAPVHASSLAPSAFGDAPPSAFAEASSSEWAELPPPSLANMEPSLITAIKALGGLKGDKLEHEMAARRVASLLTPDERSKLLQPSPAGIASEPRVDGPGADNSTVETPPPKKKDPSAHASKKKEKHVPNRRRGELSLQQRVVLGKRFLSWQSNQKRRHGKGTCWGASKFFHEEYHGYNGSADRLFLNRCVALSKLDSQGRLACDTRRHKRRADRKLGRHRKAQELREALFSWFVGLRKLVKGRFPMSLLKQQAKYLQEKALVAAARENISVDLPDVSNEWIRQWRKEFHVSLRKPTRKFKVPRSVFNERCRITWCNVYRARLLVFLLLGYEPEVDGFDQTPFHFNESGSKCKATLDFTGSNDIGLRELHTATRSRWSATTYTSSDPTFFDESGITPLEYMFKGGSGVLKDVQSYLDGLRVGEHIDFMKNVTVATSDKGSYNLDDVLRFLRRHLRPWGPGRKWRILLADAFSAHLCEAVRQLCFTRGYLLVYIGGGCTCTMQVNDTHLHHPLSRGYQEQEMQWLAAEMAEDPGKLPIIKRSNCIDLLWCQYKRPIVHHDAAKGYRDLLFTLPLDGSQDHMAKESTLRLFKDVGMPHLRTLIQADMKSELDAGQLELTYKCFERLLEPFPHRGQLDTLTDGMDDEYDPDDEDDPWDDAAGLISDDEEAENAEVVPVVSPLLQCSDTDLALAGPSAVHVSVQDDLSVQQQADVQQTKANLERIEDIIDKATGFCGVGVINALHRSRAKLRKYSCGSNAMDEKVARVLQQTLADDEAKRASIQERNQRGRSEAIAIKGAKKKLAEDHADVIRKQAELRKRLEKAQLAEDCQNATLAFDNRDFSEAERGKSVAFKNRWNAFRRVMLLVGGVLSADRISTLMGDFMNWENTVQSRHRHTTNSYVNFFRHMIGGNLILIHEGREEKVGEWWETQLDKYVLKASLVLPALKT